MKALFTQLLNSAAPFGWPAVSDWAKSTAEAAAVAGIVAAGNVVVASLGHAPIAGAAVVAGGAAYVWAMIRRSLTGPE